MISLSLDTDGLTGETFDKSESDLQENIVIANGAITGTLKYVTGYQAFSGDEQNGNFIAVHADVDDDAVVTAEVVNGVHGPVTLDASRVVIFRITSKDTQKLKFVATKNGDSTTYEFDLSGLTLNNA